jgi:hypothetical protein
MKILVAISREAFTFSDTICGIFADNEDGLRDARNAADAYSEGGDESIIFRASMGVALGACECMERVE